MSDNPASADNKSLCSAEDCRSITDGYGLCSAHYTRFKKHGSVIPDIPSQPGVIWKPVAGFDKYYLVSNTGLVKPAGVVVENGRGLARIYKTSDNGRGYEAITLTVNKKPYTRYIHRLVAQAFIPNPSKKPCVNHIDANRKNNNIENLEWCTHKENTAHGMKIGNIKHGKGGFVR